MSDFATSCAMFFCTRNTFAQQQYQQVEIKQKQIQKRTTHNKLELRVSFCNWHSLLNTHRHILLRFTQSKIVNCWEMYIHTQHAHTHARARGERNETQNSKITWHDSLPEISLFQLFIYYFVSLTSPFWLIQFNCKQKNVRKR